jgi:hypothetical protein
MFERRKRVASKLPEKIEKAKARVLFPTLTTVTKNPES